ncbi:glucose 1-dehydrogenase [uncultured Albimonas sp.]|uniref:SDR family NAD(P)-dependent oxidoreductase n=1 Tax=uncultured Albimonas sp. TaxID=1331701 RepID=UPI0030EE878C
MGERFKDRVVAITGAGGGLGRSIAALLAGEGARLALFDRDARRLAETAAVCPTSIQVVGDARSAADIERFAAEARAAFGPVEMLLPAAGVLGKAGAAIDNTEADFDRLFAINVKGPWLACKAFVPQMREVGRGAIVLFSSTAGLAGSPTLSLYSASKGAITLLTEAMALNHAADNIRVNCIAPGTIEGPMTDESFRLAGDAQAQAARRSLMLSGIPLRRFGEPGEIAAAVAYLLSDDAAFTTGIALPVDGGRLI